MKKLTVVTALLLLVFVTGCQADRGTTTPGNVAVAGQDAGLMADNDGERAEDLEAAEEPSPAKQSTPAAEPAQPPDVQTPESVQPPDVQTSAPVKPSAQISPAITSEKAQEAALAHAGLQAEAVQFTKTKLEKEDGRWVYEVKFQAAGSGQYAYDIDADTGAILSSEFDQHDGSPASSGGVTIDQASFIGEAKAKQIALQMVPGASEAHIKLKLDYDDGRALYEGEIHYGGQEYEFELDAASGAVLKWEAEDDD